MKKEKCFHCGKFIRRYEISRYSTYAGGNLVHNYCHYNLEEEMEGLKVKRLKEDCWGNANYGIIKKGFLCLQEIEKGVFLYPNRETAEKALEKYLEKQNSKNEN